jgi:hypothetical protein
MIFMKAVGCMANRQIARDLRCAPASVDHQIARLGRHCLLFHQLFWQNTSSQGPVVIDGFESFEFSQYFPFHLHLAVEARTGFFIHFTDSPLRRKGRMTPYQKRRRAELEERLGRPDPRAVEKDMAELLEVALRGRQEAVIRSDDHRAYPRSLAQIACRTRHEVTGSKERRDNRNPLWEVNLLELLIRHGQSQHKRETIAWSKRRQGSAEGLAMVLVWRNYIKFRWEKRCRKTPAMLKGLSGQPLEVSGVLQARIFRTRLELPPRWSEYYDRLVQTPALRFNRRHELKFAY